jgi:ABC-type transporter Mla subunit MlaD
MMKDPSNAIWNTTDAEMAGTANTVREALGNALTFMEALGYQSGDIHDDLKLAIARLVRQCPNSLRDSL